MDELTRSEGIEPSVVKELYLDVTRANNMPLINIVIALIVVGVALWLINNYIPMASGIKTVLNIVVVVAVGVWVLQTFGLWGHVTSYRVH